MTSVARRMADLIRSDENRTDPAKPAASSEKHTAANAKALKARRDKQ